MNSPYTNIARSTYGPRRFFPLLRRWMEDVLSITLTIVVIGGLILAATIYMDKLKMEKKHSFDPRADNTMVQAIYLQQEHSHSIDI